MKGTVDFFSLCVTHSVAMATSYRSPSRWLDDELKEVGIDPDILRSVFAKLNAAGRPPKPRFYEVPVINGGPTDMEIAAHRRYHYNANQHSQNKPEYTYIYNRTYPAGSFIENPTRGSGIVVRKANTHWNDWKHEQDEQAEIKAERVRLNEERRVQAERDAEQAASDGVGLSDKFANLDVDVGEDVPIDYEPLTIPIDEPLDEVQLEEAERLQPPAHSMHESLVAKDSRQMVLVCVVEYEDRMRMKAEQEADALKVKLEEARKYEEEWNEEYFRMQHLLEEEYERRVEAEYVQDEQEAEVTRLNMEVLRLKGLFESVSLVTHDALGDN
jgi:hypothetical protein